MYNMKTIKGLLLAGMFGLTGLLAGCGGGGAGGTTTTGGTTGGTTTPTATLSGTAATGAPLPAGTVITIKDAANRTVSVTGNTVGANGAFTLVINNPASYTPPFIVQADPSASTNGDELYSVVLGAMAASGTYRVNITPVTSLIVYEATKKSLATVFSAPQTYLPGLSEAQIDQATGNVVAQFPALNIANQDFIGQTFAANGTDAYDAAMDQIGIATVGFAGDVPTLKDETGAVVTYDSTTPLYPVDSLTLTAGVAQQVADGASYNLISATVLNTQNEPAKGITVNFVSSAGTLYNGEKTATANSAVTDDTGVAKLYLRSGTLTAASVTITAESSDNAAAGSTTVKFIPGISAKVSLNATPSTVAPGNATFLTAAVLDGNGNQVADGETVTFKRVTNSGEETIGTQTTTNGLAVLSYNVGTTTGTATIKAYTANGSNALTSVTIAPAVNGITQVILQSASASMIANGVSSTTLTATARDANGNGVPGATIVFSASAGTLSAVTSTNASGVATATLTAGTNLQTAVISASANGITANTSINFTAGAATMVGINAAPNAVKPGNSSIITIAVVDGNGNAVANEPVTLTFDARGSGTPSLSAVSGTTNVNGLLLVNYTAGASNGSDTLRARTSNGATQFTTISVAPANIVIGSVTTTASNGSIPVTSGTTVIRTTVRDSANALVSGATVDFTTTAGALSAASATTDINGVAQVTLTAGATVLSARIEATISGFTSATNVSFSAGAPNTVTVSAAPNAVNPGVSSTIYAYVTDTNNNPVVGEMVTFSIPTKGSGLPTLALTTAVTNANGLASVTYTAGAANGSDTVSVITSNEKVGTVNITVNTSAKVVGSITLISGATTLPADGTSTTTLRATVLTNVGQPASGVTVNFTASGGSLSVASATTDANGIAEVTLTSAVRTGSVTVIAEASGFLASQTVTMVAGAPTATKFVLSASPSLVNAGGVSALTAIVLDANDNPVAGQTVTFTITTNSTQGSVTPVTATTSANGIAVSSYTGGNTLGTDTIRAALVGGLTTTTTVQVTGNVLNALSIATNRTTVKSDNSEAAVITVTALSSQNVVVPGVTVSFTADGGQLSSSQGVTDASGAVSVNLLPGTLDKSNRTVTVTASTSGASAVLIPVRVVGSTVAIDVTNLTLTAGGASSTVTITARDASGLGIYNVPVTLSQSGTGSLNITATSGNTDANGQFSTTVFGVNPGSVTLSATALGSTASQATAVLPGSTFAITSPASSPSSMSTGGTLAFTVNAPTETQVRFATTIGTWSICPGGTAGGSVCTATVAAGSATATLTSTDAGIAGIQVDGLDGSGNVTGTDTHTVAISSTVATSVTLQASASNVQPSTGGALNTVTLIATLRDASGQPVGNVPVAFSLLNTTGGGESLSPVIRLSSDGVASTDPLGQARTTFTSGSLPSGQGSSSIQIQATAVGGAALPATVNIVVGGAAGSVVIGQASHFTESYQATAYTTPMTVQVADSNGNPVPGGTVVSLSAWPTAYSQGGWVSAGGDGTDCSPVFSGGSPHINEDINENLILDAGEDTNGDLILTPANSTAGTLLSSVTTDPNGLAKFDLTYLKQYAAWVKVRVRATALVQGTEATGNLVFTLPWLQVDSDACVLPNSPFN